MPGVKSMMAWEVLDFVSCTDGNEGDNTGGDCGGVDGDITGGCGEGVWWWWWCWRVD